MKKRYIYTMQYYSATRKDEILPFVTTWVDPENVMLSKISQEPYDFTRVGNKTETHRQTTV